MSIKAEMVLVLDEVGHQSINSNALASYLLSRGFAKVECTFAELIAGINLCKLFASDKVTLNSSGSIDDILEGISKIQTILEHLMKCKSGG